MATTLTPIGTTTFACGCRTHILDGNGIGPALEYCDMHAKAGQMIVALQLARELLNKDTYASFWASERNVVLRRIEKVLDTRREG